MANPIKGEVACKIGEQEFILLYDFNALCTIEADLGVDVEQLGERLASPTMIRSIFRIGLEAKHGLMTDLEAGNLIHQLGVQPAAEVIAKAFQAAFPDPGASAEGKAAIPKKPGTGKGR
jgi:hypothetical protein